MDRDRGEVREYTFRMMSPIKALLTAEPWRSGDAASDVGEPSWSSKEWCPGSVIHDSSGAWFCTQCGHASSLTTTKHRALKDPQQFFYESLGFFLSQRLKQGKNMTHIIHELFVMCGSLFRKAALEPISHSISAKTAGYRA